MRAVSRDAGDERLQLHMRNRRLIPLHLAVNHFAPDSSVPAGLVLSEELFFLDVNLRKPLHVRNAVPTRHEQSKWRTLMLGERFAVQCPCEERLVRHRFLAIEASSELLVEFVFLSPKLHFLLAVVGTKKDELARCGFDAGGIENSLQRNSSPAAVAGETLQRTAIPRTFETRYQLCSAHLF